MEPAKYNLNINIQIPQDASPEEIKKIKCLTKLQEILSGIEKSGKFNAATKGRFTRIANELRKSGFGDLARQIDELKNKITSVVPEAIKKAAASARRRPREDEDINEGENPAEPEIGQPMDVEQDEEAVASALKKHRRDEIDEGNAPGEQGIDVQPMDVAHNEEAVPIHDAAEQLKQRVRNLQAQFYAPAARLERAMDQAQEAVVAPAKKAKTAITHIGPRGVIAVGSAIHSIWSLAPVMLNAENAAQIFGAAAYIAIKTAVVATGILVTVAAAKNAWERLGPNQAPPPPQPPQGDQDPKEPPIKKGKFG